MVFKRKIPSDIYDCATPLFAEPPGNFGGRDGLMASQRGKTIHVERKAVREAFILCYLYSL
jgi:hypothetical protein